MEKFKEYITKNYREIILMASLCLCAVILASIIAQFIGIKYYTLPAIAVSQSKTKDSKSLSLEEYQSALKSIFPTPALAPVTSPSGTSEKPASGESELGNILSDEAGRGQLRLIGTVMGDSVSLAMFEYNSKQYVLKEKEKAGRFTLETVGKSWAEFKAGAVVLTVSMKFGGAGGSTSVDSGDGAGAATGTIRKVVSKANLNKILDLPQQMAKDVNFTPISRNGKPYGIQLSFLRKGSFLEDLGFEPGDIMLNMNNQDLRNPEDALRAIQIMRNEELVSLRMQRKGRFIQLEIEIK